MPEQGIKNDIPPNFVLRNTLQNSGKTINRVAWSPNGKILASALRDEFVQLWDIDAESIKYTLQGNFNYSIAWSPDGRLLASGSIFFLFLWDTETGKLLAKLRTPTKANKSVSWSPDGTILATGSDDGIIRLWDIKLQEVFSTFYGHDGDINSIAWSPDGRTLASGSDDSKICLWDIEKGELISTFTEHSDAVNSVIWSPDGRTLASGSSDTTTRIWDIKERRLSIIIKGHIGPVVCITFSYDGRLIASKSLDGTVRLWRSDTGKIIATINEPALSYGWYAGLTFHPQKPLLATLGELDTVIHIWDVDINAIYGDIAAQGIIQYKSAKVILVGEGGVGKTSLSLVLTDRPYIAPESTHGRDVHLFDSKVATVNRLKEARETFLWDLAGQQHYRLIHQLHLNEVTLALIVFDAHSHVDPCIEINYWDRILRLVQLKRGNPAFSMKKFVVAARIDRGRRIVTHDRISNLMGDLKIDEYFETSAREGTGIIQLVAAIKSSIDWEMLPKVDFTQHFHTIKGFITKLRDRDWQLSTIDNLYKTFLFSQSAIIDSEEFLTQFQITLDLIESQGLIKKLTFGSFVLLKPELLDYYASALINTIENDETEEGLGAMLEERVLDGDFDIPPQNRIRDKELEKILLIAMIEHLQRHEIVLREYVEDVSRKKSGLYLVFPSLFTRELPNLVDTGKKTVVFSFEGPVLNIYAILAVRLSHSNLFRKHLVGKNAITFSYSYHDPNKNPVICGIFLQDMGESVGEITLSFDDEANSEVRSGFEQYIYAYLQSCALPESIKRELIFTCLKCKKTFSRSTIRHRKERGFTTITCDICDCVTNIDTPNEEVSITGHSRFVNINNASNEQKESEILITTSYGISQAKIMRGEYDVFLCYKPADKAGVKRIRQQLMIKGLAPWFDEHDLRPGFPWQRQLEQQIKNISAAAVFIGKTGIEPWQELQIEAFLREFVNKNCPVIPVLLSEASHKPELPPFLKGMAWVDFRKKSSEAYIPPLDHTPSSKFYPAPNLPLESSSDDLDFDQGLDDPMDLLVWGITGKRVHTNSYETI